MPETSADGFTVDPTALRHMAQSLVVISAHLDTAHAVARDAALADFGSPDLAQATSTFVEHWRWQSRKVGEHLSAASDALRAAAENYQAVEDAQKRAEGLT